jgi:hypothetical protein
MVFFNRIGRSATDCSLRTGGLGTPAYLKALGELTTLADADGMATAFHDRGVHVLMAPCNGPAEVLDTVWGDLSDASGSGACAEALWRQLRFASIASISSMIAFICAASAWYGAGVARSTPACLTSS